MEWLGEVAKEYGLFVALVVYTLWDGRLREKRLISVIDNLSSAYKKMSSDVDLIKRKLWGD